MGKLTQFEILLDNPEAVYSDGQLLQGDVIVNLKEDMRINGIHLDVKGSAFVQWTERGRTERTFSAMEVYIDDKINIFGTDTEGNGDNSILSAGRHVYHFQYQLPHTIPSSMKGKHGKVHYWILGRFSEPWKPDHTTKRPFTILNELDLNSMSEAKLENRGSDSKQLCCLCCKSGPIRCTLHLERCGYVLGESIPIRGEIINKSNRTISKTCAELLMMVTYRGKYIGDYMTNYNVETVSEISRGQILPGDSDIWNGHLLPVPSRLPPTLSGCDIISISYSVNLRVEPAGPSMSLEVPLYVIIGTIPLKGIRQHRPHGIQPRQFPHTTRRYEEQPDLPLMSPPSYAETTFGVADPHHAVSSDPTEGTKYVQYNMV